jgi:hypothetical protein
MWTRIAQIARIAPYLPLSIVLSLLTIGAVACAVQTAPLTVYAQTVPPTPTPSQALVDAQATVTSARVTATAQAQLADQRERELQQAQVLTQQALADSQAAQDVVNAATTRITALDAAAAWEYANQAMRLAARAEYSVTLAAQMVTRWQDSAPALAELNRTVVALHEQIAQQQQTIDGLQQQLAVARLPEPAPLIDPLLVVFLIAAVVVIVVGLLMLGLVLARLRKTQNPVTIISHMDDRS